MSHLSTQVEMGPIPVLCASPTTLPSHFLLFHGAHEGLLTSMSTPVLLGPPMSPVSPGVARTEVPRDAGWAAGNLLQSCLARLKPFCHLERFLDPNASCKTEWTK